MFRLLLSEIFYAMQLWNSATITFIEQQSSTTRRFFLETETPIQFTAGQFIILDLPISDKRQKRWRSYSIANAPKMGGNKILELCVVHAANSTGGSEYLFNEIKVGSQINFKKPDGGFTLQHNLETVDTVLICTGTGVAPFRSMIQNIIFEKKEFKRIHLIFGARTVADILYFDEFKNLRDNDPRFVYDVCLSKDKTDFTTSGYVHSIIEAEYKTFKPDISFYLCGWQNMIDDAVEKLIEYGYARHQIHYELYG